MSVRVHHRVDGPADGEPVVLSGSLGSDLWVWEPQVRALTHAGYRVVRHDHRGHGRSPTPPGPYSVADLGDDLLALLDQLDLDRCYLVGLSLGGAVGMWLGSHAPERLTGLALCCTSARFGSPQAWAQRARIVRRGGTAAIAGGVVERWLTPEYAAADPALVRWLQAMVSATPAEGYAACCAAIEQLDLRDELAGIHAPTLVVAGAQDPAVPRSHAELLAERIPCAAVEVLDPAAHLATLERAEPFNDLLLTHLTTVHHRREAR